ncbi:MAG: PaaI family thioesterase [Myxococcaceae bacterium]|nr:PaaI family thioesterase [Myxococcaceae bacterium]MCI0669239.1 PaaI family thioesterase [Myxococcaceae bacterium]
MDEEKKERLESLNALFVEGIPHNAALGLKLVDVGPAPGQATMVLPYDEKLVGNPETGVLHGGAVTTLMDAACGTAVFLSLPSLMRVATLDLRIDYLHPARPGQALTAEAECYKLTRQVAFVRALAHHGDPSDPVAHAAGTFILTADAPMEGA